VDGNNWEEYFGPFAGRAFRLHSEKAKLALEPPGDADEQLERPLKRQRM
jgi:hypothetical protein